MLILYTILAFIFVFILNNTFLATYCRLAKKRDRVIQKRRTTEASKVTLIPDTTSETSGKKSKRLIRTLDSYFYGWTRYCAIQIGKFPSNGIRNRMFRFIFGMEATNKTVINGGCELRSPWNIKADNCVIGNNCLLDGRFGIEIGNYVVFGADVRIWTMEHDVQDPWFRVTADHALPVKIGDRAWICSGASILPGICIGEGAVVASRACIIKDCEEFSIYGGVPAKRIGSRNQDLKYTLSGKPTWRFY